MPQILDLPAITVLVGHAGTGKTNAAIGLARAAAAASRTVTLADLDIVNPYFRSSDYPQYASELGIHLIAPVFARTTLDTPSLTGELDVVINRVAFAAAEAAKAGTTTKECLIIDVGGDDIGATALGRYSRALAQADAWVLYVVSAFRALTAQPAEAVDILAEVEENARLKASAILNASNLADVTSAENVAQGRAYAREVAQLTGLPLVATLVPRACAEDVAAQTGESLGPTQAAEAPAGVALALTEGNSDHEPLVVMPRFVRTPWDDAL